METFGTEGKWNVIVQDSKIDSNIVQCEVNIVKPDRIMIVIDTLTEEGTKKDRYTAEEFQLLVNPIDTVKSNWYLISETKYRIRTVLYWRNKEITSTPSAIFTITFSESRLWEIVSRSRNGAEMIVIPRLPSDFSNNIYPTKISAKLDSFDSTGRNCRLDSVLTDTEEANIIQQLRIIEEKRPVLLPYFAVLTQSADKKGHLAQEYRLKVTGGSFALRWDSSDNAIASVASNGIVYAHRLGTITVTVIDMNNEKNRDSIEIEVALVEKLVWEYERIEIVKGSSEISEIKGLASRGRIFHNCSSIFLDWELRKGQETLKVKNKILVEDDRRKNGVCEIRNIDAVSEGQATISTHLVNQATEISAKAPEIRLSSEEGRVGIFLPLSLSLKETYDITGNNKTHTFFPDKYAMVLVPGSTALLELIGGPLPWDDYSTAHVEAIKDKEHSSIIGKRYSSDKRYLQLKCPDGSTNRDFYIELSIFNNKFEKLNKPGLSTLEIVLGCQKPFTMKLD